MEVEFFSHFISWSNRVFFATDPQRPNIFTDDVKNSFRLTPVMKYIIDSYKDNQSSKFIDIGANIGTFSLPVAKSGIKTLAIEALAHNHSLLTQAVHKNELHNLIPVHAAATNFNGTINITGVGAWAQINNDHQGSEIPAFKIDTLAKLFDFMDVNIIKIDVEGAEMMVLEGMADLLEKNPNVEIIFESNAYTCGLFNYSTKELKQFFKTRGYNIYAFTSEDTHLRSLSEDSFQDVIIVDYLATKKDLSYFVKEATPEERINSMLADIEPSIIHAAYFINNVKQAPKSIKEDHRIQTKLKELLSNENEQLDRLLTICGVGAG